MFATVRIIDERVAVFTCKGCKQQVRIGTSDFIYQPAHKLNLTCSCGHANRAVIEYRQSIRKRTNIPGIYKISDGAGNEKTGSMTVKDISWKGFKLKISGYEHCIKEHDVHSDRYTLECHNSRSIFIQSHLKVGDQTTIEFFLDDPKMSFISRVVTVNWIKNDHVGVELCYPEEFEPSIRFYLLGLQVSAE